MFNKKNSVKLELNYRGFDKIEGSDFLVSPLSSAEQGFKGNIHYTAHNYLFLNVKDFSTHWLFPANNQQIVTFYKIPLENSQTIKENIFHEKFSPVYEDNFDREKIKETGWLLLVFIKLEINQDKKIISLSDVSGKNLVEILKDVDLLYDVVRVNKEILVLMYRSNEEIFVSEINLPEFTIVKTKALPKINERNF